MKRHPVAPPAPPPVPASRGRPRPGPVVLPASRRLRRRDQGRSACSSRGRGVLAASGNGADGAGEVRPRPALLHPRLRGGAQLRHRPRGPAARRRHLLPRGGNTNFVQAEAKYRDFLNRFPTSEQAAYVQFQIANSLAKRMEKPDRDQTTTRKALEAYEDLVRLYPTSEYATQAQEKREVVRANLAEHESRGRPVLPALRRSPRAAVRSASILPARRLPPVPAEGQDPVPPRNGVRSRPQVG